MEPALTEGTAAAADPVVRLLERAALDGHTAVPLELVRAVAGDRYGDGVVEAEVGGRPHLALERLASAEQAVADLLGQCAVEGRLEVVLGPQSPVDAADRVVVPDLQLLGVEACAARLAEVPDDAVLRVAGDPDLLPGRDPGEVLRALVESPLPVEAGVELEDRRDQPSSPPALAAAAADVRAGRLPRLDPADTTVVRLGATDDVAAAQAVARLVGSSIPRAFGTSADRLAVLTPLVRGPAGADALAGRLTGAATVLTVHDAQPARFESVVLVLPGQAAGVLSRALVLTGVTRATRHLSVVDAAGPAVAEAVARVPRRRTTLLPTLLRG